MPKDVGIDPLRKLTSPCCKTMSVDVLQSNNNYYTKEKKTKKKNKRVVVVVCM